MAVSFGPLAEPAVARRGNRPLCKLEEAQTSCGLATAVRQTSLVNVALGAVRRRPSPFSGHTAKASEADRLAANEMVRADMEAADRL